MSEKLVRLDADVASRCRAVSRPGAYYILPRANRVMSTLPHFRGTTAQVMAAPETGARFCEHELHVAPGGGTTRPVVDGLEPFVFVLEGEIDLETDAKRHSLAQGGYAWLPPGRAYELCNRSQAPARVIWFRRRFQPVDGLAVPGPIVANEADVPALTEDTYLEQHLVPYENPAFDLGFNLLNFEPGIYFSFVESHIMEHGLYMLEGCGIYWLNGDYVEVQAGDFIYMAPFCPQFFWATGRTRARYLIYKDVNRDYAGSLGAPPPPQL